MNYNEHCHGSATITKHSDGRQTQTKRVFDRSTGRHVANLEISFNAKLKTVSKSYKQL